MIVRNILFCESLINLNGGPGQIKSAILEPTYTYQLQYIPTAFSFAIFIMMQGIPDKKTELRITFKKLGEDKNILDAIQIMDENIPISVGIPKEEAGINVNMPLTNFPIEHEGEYICEVYIDGEIQKTEILKIFRK